MRTLRKTENEKRFSKRKIRTKREQREIVEEGDTVGRRW